MRACWYCKKTISPTVRICPFCTADQETPGTPPKRARRLEELRKGQPRGMVVMAEQAAPRSRRWLWLAALVVGIVAIIWALLPTRLHTDRLAPFNEATCVEHDRCVVVYVAGWSPATKRTLGSMRRLQPLLAKADTGLGAVIASDEDDVFVDALAEALPVGGWLDTDDRMLKDMDIETVPTWFVIDSSGKVLNRVDGTYFPLSYHRQKLGI
jgi:hypothetical protein